MKLMHHQNILVEDLEMAKGFAARAIGLMGREKLAENSGLWIHNCWDIQTCFMRFPIDVVFLDKNMKVISTHKNIKPWRFQFSWGADSVVELPAGKINDAQIQIGDHLNVVD